MTVRLRATIVLAAVLLAFYLATLGWRAVILISGGDPLAVVLGVALLVIAGVGVWAVVAEIRFGVVTAALGRQLAAEDAPPTADVPTLPSGRVDRRAAEASFDTYRAAVEADPENWQVWFRLALAYDRAGDRRRARSAARAAIALSGQPPS